jgi:hypothetical protein
MFLIRKAHQFPPAGFFLLQIRCHQDHNKKETLSTKKNLQMKNYLINVKVPFSENFFPDLYSPSAIHI